ncbi:MAG: hypothetical protein AAB776_01605, partial [Patescibacteria group bacterium]
MIDIKLLRENPHFFRDSAKAKNIDIDVERILELDRRVRSLKTELEGIKAQKNEASKEITKATPDQRKLVIESMRHIDRRAETLEAEYTPLADELVDLMYKIPNPSLPDVKIGKSDAENEVVREVGDRTVLNF